MGNLPSAPALLLGVLLWLGSLPLLGQNTATAVDSVVQALAQEHDPKTKIRLGQRGLSLLQDDPKAEGYFHQELGHAYYALGDLQSALSSYLVAADLFLGTDDDGYATVNNSIGLIYLSQENYALARKYLRRALEMHRELEGANAKKNLAADFNNLGEVYRLQGALDSALYWFGEARSHFLTLGDSVGLGYALGNIGLVYAEQGADAAAEQYIDRARHTMESVGDYYPIAIYHTYSADIYEKQGDYDAAESYLQESLRIAQRLARKEQIRDAAQALAAYHRRRDQPNQAMAYQDLYYAYRDSLYNADIAAQNAEARATFEISLAEAESDKLAYENQALRARQVAYLFGFGFLLLALSGGGLYLRYRRRREVRQQNEQVDALLQAQDARALEAIVQGQEQERKRLAKELHDHFGSLLATVQVNLQTAQIQDGQQRQQLWSLVNQACEDVRSLSHSLHAGIEEGFGLQSAVQSLADTLQQSGVIQTEVSVDIPPHTVTLSQEVALYRIIQELISNVLKHAQAQLVSIQISGFQELISLMVEDDGRGFDPAAVEARAEGLGLRNLRDRVAALDGELTIDSRPGKGTVVSIDVPIAAENSPTP